MKILHYIPSIDQNSGGVGAYLKLLSHSLGKIAELHIVTHHSANELTLENCTIHYIDDALKFFFRIRKQFVEILESLDPDVVHVNACWLPLCSFTVFWAKQKGYKVVVSPHGMLEPWVIQRNYLKKKLPALLLYQKKALRKADALIATAESEQQNLQKLGYCQNVRVVPNGVVSDGISLKTSWKRTHTILYMGLLRPNKGAGVLIDAVNLIRNRIQDYKVIVAGPDTEGYLSSLKEKVKSLGLEDMVTFPGGVFGDDKWKLFENADVFVLPTLNENFGIVVAESLLKGTPVITCKGAPWKGLVENKCGWWVNRTPDEIAVAIQECLALPEDELEAMGRRGRQFVIDNYSSNIVAERMLKLYKDVIKRSSNVVLTTLNGGVAASQ